MHLGTYNSAYDFIAQSRFAKSAAIFKQAGMESDYAWTQHYRAVANS